MATQRLRPRRNSHRIHGIHTGAKTLLLRVHRSTPQTMITAISRPFRSKPHFLGTPISRLAPSAIRCSGGSSRPLLFFFLFFSSPPFSSPPSPSPPPSPPLSLLSSLLF